MEDEYFFNKIGFWMDLIIARVPNATILIVPTRLDDVYKHSGNAISCKHSVTEKCKDIIQRAHKQVKERNNEVLFEFKTQRVENGKQNCLKPNLPNSIQISLKDIITVSLCSFSFVHCIFKRTQTNCYIAHTKTKVKNTLRNIS